MSDWQRYVCEHLPPLGVAPAREREIVAELAQQLEQAYQEALASGAGEGRRAEREIGDWAALARAIAAAEAPVAGRVPLGGGRLLSDLLRDLRQGLRQWVRNPGFTAVALLTLALGIGANTAIFSIVNPMLFQALPFPRAERILEVAHFDQDGLQNNLTGTEGLFLAAHQRSMAAVAMVDYVEGANLSGAGTAARVSVVRVTHGFFQVFGAAPVRGRSFTSADDQPGTPLTAVLSDGLWRSQFGADPNVLGRTFRMNGRVYTVVGVMPRSFTGFRFSFDGVHATVQATDLWIDLQPTAAGLAALGPNLDFLGRLRSGVTLNQANADLALQYAAFRKIHPGAERYAWGAQSYHDAIVGNNRLPLLLLLGAVLMVLVIACANIASLLLSRATARAREMAIQAAIGANRGRLMRQLLTENLLLGLAGAALGWLLAGLSVPLLRSLTPPDLALPLSAGLNFRVLLFTVALGVATGALFGLVPVLHARRSRLPEQLKAGDAGAFRTGRARGALVVAEIAIAFVLLAGAALLTDSLFHLNRVDTGFDTHNVLTAQTTLTGARLATDAAATQYSERVLAALRAIPGVAAAASITGVPLTRGMNYPVAIPGRAVNRGRFNVEWRAVSPDFFRTLEIPIVQGRGFQPADTAAAAKVAIVSAGLARKYWPGRSALGEALNIPEPSGLAGAGTVVQIVGVAADMALGADRGRILRQFMGGGVRLAALGLLIGAIGALALTRLLSAFLFGVTPANPPLLVLVVLGLLLLAGIASLRPAWRAACVDPWEALRHE